tara:strand:+ start:1717 stop:2703 length:987 start_codon:yes stop_codon:yes gene_type:complete
MATKKFQLSSIKSFILQVLFNGYEKDKVDLYLNDKIAYDKGFRYFKGRFPNLTNSSKHNLSHCQGLAETSRKDGDLLKYSFYKYRQYELLMFEVFESNNEVVKKGDKNDYNRIKILNYLKNTNWSANTKKLNFCQNSYNEIKKEKFWLVKVKNSVTSISINTKKSESQSFNGGEIIGKTLSKKADKYNRIWVDLVNIGECRPVSYGDVYFDSYIETTSLDKNGYIEFDKHIKDDHKHFLFQSAFYWGLSRKKRSAVKSCQLNAFFLMRHYRNLYSHNKFFSEPVIYKPTPEDQLYLKDPELILTSDYFDRLIISFVQAYDDFLKQPHF